MRNGDERGSVHPLMLALALVVLLVALVVRDLGTLLVVKGRAIRAAENAAEAAAQALDEDRYLATGEVTLDPDRARALALAALRPGQQLLDLDVDGDRVVLEVQDVAVTPALLWFGGPRALHPTATESARLERGVGRPEP